MSSIQALGVRMAAQRTRRLGQDLEAVMQALLQDIATEIVAEAVRRVPVRTGRLQSSIDVLAEGKGFVEVGATAPYAGFVVFGTSTMVARPYLDPAVRRQVRRFADLWVQESHRRL